MREAVPADIGVLPHLPGKLRQFGPSGGLANTVGEVREGVAAPRAAIVDSVTIARRTWDGHENDGIVTVTTLSDSCLCFVFRLAPRILGCHNNRILFTHSQVVRNNYCFDNFKHRR